MRPVDKNLYTKNQATYNPYGNAKDDLFEAIGEYCTFCERRGHSSALDVEHIEHVEKNKKIQKSLIGIIFYLPVKIAIHVNSLRK